MTYLFPVPKLLNYRVRESKRATRVSLRVLPPDGSVEVLLPLGHDRAVAPLLVERHRQWIAQQQQKMALRSETASAKIVENLPEKIHLLAINSCMNIIYQPIDNASSIKTECDNSALLFTGKVSSKKLVACGLQDYLKSTAKKVLPTWLQQLLDQRCQQYGLQANRVTVRLQQSRWGSCSAKGNISLNAKLLLLPPPLVDHIILHELAHLRFHNHSQAYWDFFALLDPQWQQHKIALRQMEATMPAWVGKISC